MILSLSAIFSTIASGAEDPDALRSRYQPHFVVCNSVPASVSAFASSEPLAQVENASLLEGELLPDIHCLPLLQELHTSASSLRYAQFWPVRQKFSAHPPLFLLQEETYGQTALLVLPHLFHPLETQPDLRQSRLHSCLRRLAGL